LQENLDADDDDEDGRINIQSVTVRHFAPDNTTGLPRQHLSSSIVIPPVKRTPTAEYGRLQKTKVRPLEDCVIDERNYGEELRIVGELQVGK